MRAAVKRGIAVAGAGALGVGGALVAATPAAADPVTGPACASQGDHGVSSTPVAGWYMDCVPQFGAGKAEFTLLGDPDIPEGFETDLSEPEFTISNPLGDEMNSYYSSIFPGFTGEPSFEEGISSSTELVYSVSRMVIPITGIETIEEDALPDGCEADTLDYDGAWLVTFGAQGTTISQTVDGEEWSWELDYTPAPMYLALNIDDIGDWLDTEAPQCASGAGGTYLAADSGSGNWTYVTGAAAIDFEPFVDGSTGNWTVIGDFEPTVTPLEEEEEEPPAEEDPEEPAEEDEDDEELAPTGADASAALGLSALLAGLGVVAVAAARRTRRA